MDTEKNLKFPDNFLWGAATAAHQVEGGNVNDWSEWEKQNAHRLACGAKNRFAYKVPDWNKIKDEATNPNNYISGKSVDHYNHYQEDIGIMKSLGFNTFRFSIEWSRIEPKQGEFNKEAIEHYRSVIIILKENNIEPFVTLWHWTSPLWISEIGGWENSATVSHYLNYVKKMAQVFSQDIKFWMPINEPLMPLTGGYLGGVFPPGKKNPLAARKVFNNMVKAHNEAYKIIHTSIVDAKVGIPHAAIYAEAYKNRWYNKAIVNLLFYLADWRYLNAIKNSTDFIGVQYYTRGVVRLSLNKYFLPTIEQLEMDSPKSDMGWEIYPQGMYNFIKMAWQRYHKPIYVTENGITDSADKYRAQYIKDHLVWLHKALEEGVDIRGYFYWSLLDNQEWDKGFWPKFGLIEVDRSTMERKVRPSAYEYAELIKKYNKSTKEAVSKY